MPKNLTYRRGLNLVEALSSLVIIVLLSSFVFSTVNFVMRQTRETAAYTRLKVYTVGLASRIETDMKAYANGEPGAVPVIITDYSDDGETEDVHGNVSGVNAVVVVTQIEPDEIFGEHMYYVEYRLKDLDTGCKVEGNMVLREGCMTGA